jgi:cell division protein FtsZ
MFTFDMPKNEEEKPKQQAQSQQEEQPKQDRVIHKLTEDDTSDMEVNNPKEVSPVAKQQNGVTRYSLDDYMEVEQMLKNSGPEARKKKEHEPEIKKPGMPEPEPVKSTAKPAEKKTETEEEIDPFNSPINESLVKRAAERRAKMKEFNYKFRNNVSRLEDIEKQPAYKRAGIDLDNSKPGEERISRTTLGTGDDNEIRFRSNNSFLHDNVD